MALISRIDLSGPFGIDHAFDGYFVVTSVNVDKMANGNSRIARVMVLAYASRAAKDAGKSPVTNDNDEFVFNAMDSTNLFTQAYNHLKTLPRFANATDA